MDKLNRSNISEELRCECSPQIQKTQLYIILLGNVMVNK